MKKIVCALVLSLIGCKSAPPVVLNDVSEGHWRAKALVRDKDQGRSFIVNLDFNALKSGTTRMDVMNTLGTGIAALVVNPQEVRYVLLEQKRYYIGPPTAESLRPILALPFDPRWISNLLFDQPLTGWTCARDTAGMLESCREPKSETVVTWSNRQGEKKTIAIEHPRASLQINVSAFQPKVEDRKNLFLLEAPAGFQKLRVK